MRGSLPVEGSHVGRRQQNRRANSFLGPATNAGGQATREINTGLRSYVLTSLVRTGDAPFWTYVVAPVTMPRKGGRTPTIVF